MGSVFMNEFNEKEFMDLCSKLNIEPLVEEKTIRYSESSFFNRMKRSIQKDRRGEVVFCVIRPDGKIITTTCKEYPKGIYRIPTGGIGHKEDIIKAVFRETMEELGLQTEIKKFIGAIKIRFEHGDDHVMFYSYLFILNETGGRLLADASDDEISEVREVDIDGLEKVADSLANITGKWSDWGKFRYLTTNAVLNYLRECRDHL